MNSAEIRIDLLSFSCGRAKAEVSERVPHSSAFVICPTQDVGAFARKPLPAEKPLGAWCRVFASQRFLLDNLLTMGTLNV